MAELWALVIIFGVLGAACFIGWSAGVLLDAYWKYRVKRNRIKYPELVELKKEREKLCEKYYRWWDEKYEAKKRIDKDSEILKYLDTQSSKECLSRIEQNQQIYTNANKHMEELSPLVSAAREAEQAYREKYNIRHW